MSEFDEYSFMVNQGLRNVILGENNKLSNRSMLVNVATTQPEAKSATSEISKSKICTLNYTKF